MKWYLISYRVAQLAYFDQMLDGAAWKNSKILDFGGNVAGFLEGAGDAVEHENYWCMDINREVLELGRRRFPRAHFVHYDRYSTQYNVSGTRYLPIPDCGVKFDIIISFSVFTHVHECELHELVGQLRNRLTPEGILAFTFTDPAFDRSLSSPSMPSGTGVRGMLERQLHENPSLDIDGMVERAAQSKWCVLIDDELYIEPGHELSHQERQGKPGSESYCSYFSVDYMWSLFPEAKVLPPVSPEWQHCCLLRHAKF